MLFPLLATRLLARNAVVASKVVFRQVPTSQITRNFSVSKVAWAPAAAKAKSIKSPAKKAAAKKATTTTRRASKKTAVVKKTTARAKKAAPKAKKEGKKAPAKIKILPEHKPPKAPAGPSLLFYRDYLKGKQPQEGEKPLDFVRRCAKESGPAWKMLSDAEKQRYRDEFTTAQAEYQKKLEEYKQKTDPAIIRELNRRRVARGKRRMKVYSPMPTSSGYIVFWNDHRSSLGSRPITEACKEVAGRWRALSDSEKAVYNGRARAAREAWKAEHLSA